MILKVNTDILPLVNPGLYGTLLGSYLEDVPEEDYKHFKEYLCDYGKEIMNEIFEEDILVALLGKVEVKEISLYSPMFYNYQNDSFDFSIEVDDDIHNKIHSHIFNKTVFNITNDFFEWIYERYKSRDGFISFMPYTKGEYLTAIQDITSKNFERSIAMFITFLTESEYMNYALSMYQENFEDMMNDACLLNGWYEYEEDEEENK